jgi:segregation and condensation protein B
VPGKPALFGTTRSFLDYFDLNNLDDLPTLAEIRDMENLEPELDLEPAFPDNEEAGRDDGPDAMLDSATDSSNENDQDDINNKLETQNMTSPGVDYEVQDDQATVDDDLTVDDDSEESIKK